MSGATRRVRMTRTLAKQAGRDWIAFQVGETYTVPNDLADRWVSVGAAEPVGDDQKGGK